MRISGGCLCGKVRFEGEAEPQFQVKCYCVDCRRTSGAGHASMMGFLEPREFSSLADRRNTVAHASRPRCGSGVDACNGGMPRLIFVRASALDDPDLFSPQAVVWTARAPRWGAVTSGIPAFATGD